MSQQLFETRTPESHEQGPNPTQGQELNRWQRIRGWFSTITGRSEREGGSSGGSLNSLIKIAESRQVPALINGADATHTIAGADGPRMRFEGQGTAKGDETLLSSVHDAVQQMDLKRERETTGS